MTDAGRDPTPLLILDACVLIDYIKAEPGLFKIIAGCIGPVHVVSTVYEEVVQLTSSVYEEVVQLTSLQQMADLGISLVEPEIDDGFEAEQMTGRTSFQDNICLLTAKRLGMICITNDRSLRTACFQHNVPIMWGLELLLQIVESGGLDYKSAIEIGRQIHANNPRHISPKVIADFEKKLSSMRQ